MILGLGYDGFHDSNVALLNDSGDVVFAVSEERLTTIKKDGRFPSHGIAAARPSDNAILCVSTLEDNECRQAFRRAGQDVPSLVLAERTRTFRNIDTFKERFREVHFFSHHDCHAASAYYFSGLDEALVLTWDAGNNSEPWNMTVYLGRGASLERVEESADGLPALDYGAVTALLGFVPNRHEGKVTGLSAAGSASASDIARLETVLADHKTQSSCFGEMAYWRNVGSAEKVPTIILRRKRIEQIRKRLRMEREDLANAIQRLTERRVLKKVAELRDRYETKNICLAGGLFANVLLNKRIKELGFDNITIHPAMGDDGLGLGACARFLGLRGMRPVRLRDVFFGPGYSDQQIEHVLLELGVAYYRANCIEEDIADRLQASQIVARFSGRLEYGPRALGNRSVLCAATDVDINDALNAKLKRSEFMPFAPATLKEDATRLFHGVDGTEYTSEFMTIALDCTEEMKRTSPAVVHVDGTARPQLVGEANEGLRRILLEYKKRSTLSSIINTSFNMHESPIVASPHQALRAFYQARLDALAIGSFVVAGKA